MFPITSFTCLHVGLSSALKSYPYHKFCLFPFFRLIYRLIVVSQNPLIVEICLVIQELGTGKILWTGNLQNGLYNLDEESDKISFASKISLY